MKGHVLAGMRMLSQVEVLSVRPGFDAASNCAAAFYSLAGVAEINGVGSRSVPA
jgi:hypothetical protein